MPVSALKQRRREQGLRYVRFCKDFSVLLFGVSLGQDAAFDAHYDVVEVEDQFLISVHTYGPVDREVQYWAYPDHQDGLILLMWRSLRFHDIYFETHRFADSTGIPHPMFSANEC
jgi:hypothetical protein